MSEKARVRMDPDKRKKLIVTIAVRIANKDTLNNVTYERIAQESRMKLTDRTVRHYFTMAQLRKVVAKDKRADQHVKDDAKDAGII